MQNSLTNSTDMIDVSVIIPVYNTPHDYFSSCIDSVLTQTLKNIEVLVVDDGSTEEHSAYYKEYCCKDQRMRYIYQENQGVSAARNKGVAESCGQYIAFVDSDDSVTEWYLQEALNAANIDNLDIVIGSVCHAPCIPTKKKNEQVNCVVLNEMYEEMVRHVIGFNPRALDHGNWLLADACARLVIGKKAKQVAFPVGVPLNENSVWNMKLLQICERVGMVSDIWYIINDRRGSATKCYRPNCIEETKMHFRQIKGLIALSCPAAMDTYYCRVVQDYGLVMHLCVMHPQAKNTIHQQYVTICDMLSHEPWEDAFQKVNLDMLNKKQRLLVWCVNKRLYILAWFISYLRAKQLRKRYCASE